MSATEEAWGAVAEHLKTLGSLVIDRGTRPAEVEDGAEDVPTDDDVREAVRVISDRASATLRGLTESIADAEVRAEAELTTSAFLTAVGVSFSELGGQLADLAMHTDDEDTPDPDASSSGGDGSWELDERDLDD